MVGLYPVVFTRLVFVFLLLPSCLRAQEDPQPFDALQLRIRNDARTLPDWEREYLVHALARLYSGCDPGTLYQPASKFRERASQVSVSDGGDMTRIVQATGGSSDAFSSLLILESDGENLYKREHCRREDLLPVVGIMEAAEVESQSSNRPRSYAQRASAGLTSYEPNLIGWTFDDNDVDQGYVDAVVSMKYPFFHDGLYSSEGPDGGLYFAFTGRFSQYIESRESSPVIGKRFNPKLFGRYWLGDNSRFIDLGLGHESNGQNISSKEAYLREREDLELEGEDPDFARDYISRGWDYVSLDWKHAYKPPSGKISSYVMLKYFLDDGPFQGKPEQYNDWEGDGKNLRKQYDGLGFLGKFEFGPRFCTADASVRGADRWSHGVCLKKAAWRYTTGYDGVFENNTNRLELTIDFWNFPLMLWGQTGYNSDLVDYYKKVNSWGIALELQSANTRIW